MENSGSDHGSFEDTHLPNGKVYEEIQANVTTSVLGRAEVFEENAGPPASIKAKADKLEENMSFVNAFLHEHDAFDKTEDFGEEMLEGLRYSEEIVPSNNDVIFGKGGKSKHPGNESFRYECERLACNIKENAAKTVKHEIALELVGFVYQRQGRFLIEDRNKKGAWRDAGFDLACKKAKQLLADTMKKRKKDR